jgi:hypothetical protein
VGGVRTLWFRSVSPGRLSERSGNREPVAVGEASRAITTGLPRDHQVKPLLPAPAYSLASTLTHPARTNDSASVSGISTVPSAATFRWSRFIRPMP